MSVEEQVREIIDRVTASYGLEVWDVELRGTGGVTHEDCENVSRELSTILDIEDPIKGSYVLEVSSPGLDRKLRGPADYERFRGSLLKLQTLEPINGVRNYEGRLQNFDGNRLSLELPPKGKGKKLEPGATVEIELSNVAKANLVPEF
jgi:ribosome maturation factor RimP